MFSFSLSACNSSNLLTSTEQDGKGFQNFFEGTHSPKHSKRSHFTSFLFRAQTPMGIKQLLLFLKRWPLWLSPWPIMWF